MPAASMRRSSLYHYYPDKASMVRDLAAEILGPYALLLAGDPLSVEGGHWSHELLWSRAGTIYAGTSEVQRNIISERVLRMPRD